MVRMLNFSVKQAQSMLLSRVFIVLLITPLLTLSQNLNWSNAIEVNSGSVSGMRPRIALDDQGLPVVFFAKNAAQNQLFKTKFINNDFETPFALAGVNPFVSSAAGIEVAYKGSTIFISYESEDGGVFIVKSIDGGVSFGDTVRVDNVTDLAVLPNIDITSDLNPVVSFNRVNSSWTQIKQVVANSNDGGDSFMSDVSASTLTPNQPCECCFSKVVVEGNTQVSIFRNNENNVRNFYASVSYDGGQSFTDYIEIDLMDWNLNACPDAGPDAFLKNNKLYVTYRSGALGPNRVFVARIDITTLNVEQFIPVDESLSSSMIQKYPDIAGDENILGVVWMDNRDMLNDCFFSYSIDGFNTWSAPIYVSDSSLMVHFVDPDIAFRDNVFHFVYKNQNQNKIFYRTASVTSTSVEEQNLDLYLLNQSFIFDTPVEYKVLDSSGKLIEGGVSNQVNMSSLNSGLYFLQIPTSVHKFIKK